MSNLLPKKDKKRITKEYIGRLFGVVLVLSAATIFLNLLLSVPLYFLSENKVGSVQDRVSSLEAYLLKKNESGPRPVLAPTNEKMTVLELPEAMRVSEIIGLILAEKDGDIRINSFDLKPTSGGTAAFIIGGEASDRDSLITFSESLKSVERFVSIELPLSNLARNRDVDFDIKIEISKPN